MFKGETDPVQVKVVELIELLDAECSDEEVAQWVEKVKQMNDEDCQAVRLRAAILLGRFGTFSATSPKKKIQSWLE